MRQPLSYHSRWGIETSFRTLKYSVGMLHTHGKSDEFAMQEVFASMIMHNFASRIAGQVILQNKENNIHEYAVNMKMCIFLCQEFLRTGNGSGEQLMQDIMRYTEAVRPERDNPNGHFLSCRCIPCRHSSFFERKCSCFPYPL